MAYDNELRGVLFRNKEKAPDNKKPDYTGNATIEGTDYFMDSWINEKDGKKYMSVKFKPKQAPRNPPPREPVQQTRQQQRSESNPQGLADLDDDIPF